MDFASVVAEARKVHKKRLRQFQNEQIRAAQKIVDDWDADPVRLLEKALKGCPDAWLIDVPLCRLDDFKKTLQTNGMHIYDEAQIDTRRSRLRFRFAKKGDPEFKE